LPNVYNFGDLGDTYGQTDGRIERQTDMLIKNIYTLWGPPVMPVTHICTNVIDPFVLF